MNVRTGDTAEENVSEDYHFPAPQATEVFLHRERIQKPLRRVLMRPVSGVNDGDIQNARKIQWRTRRSVTQDNHVSIERLDVLGRVAEGFAFCRATARRVEGNDVCAQ